MKLLLLFFLFSIALCSYGQQTANGGASVEDKMREAKKLLSAKGPIKDKAGALRIYLDCARAGNLQAMNLVGYFLFKWNWHYCIER